MNTRATNIAVPPRVVQNWQEIVDLLAEIVKVPAALIMKVDPPHISVFVSSKSPGNPYHPQERASLDTGLYCETVMRTRELLLVPDALADEAWRSNPDIQLGMISYLGLPILWPDGAIFGTLCVLDDKRNDYNVLYQSLLGQCREVLQADLNTLFEFDARLAEEARAAETLRQERYPLDTLMENVPDNIYFKDAAGRFVRINNALTAYFGLSNPAQAIGKTDFDFFTEEHARAACEDEQQIMRTGVPLVGKEEKETWLDGRVRWVSSTKMPFRDKHGTIIGTFGVSRDITNLKVTEEALRASERQFRTFVDHAADAFFLQDEQGRILDVNRQACASLGYTRDELIGMTPFDFDPDLTPASIEDGLRKLDAGETVAFEARHRRKNGTMFPVEIRGRAFWEAGQRFFVSMARDISERKRAEEALRESEERFRGTFENAAVGIAHTDLDGRWLRVNEKLASILGYTVEEALGLRWQDITHPDDLRVTSEQLPALLHGERRSYSPEKRYIRKDGSTIWAQLAISLQRDAAGKPAYYIVMVLDISERKRLEGELRRAKEAAEAANQAKDEFLANVSHELRTPMTAILGMTELALEAPLPDDQRQRLRTVKSAADSLLSIINDLLDFAKIEAGKMELVPADFSLRAAVGDTLRALAARAHKKGLELISHVQPEVPDALVGDAGRLRQVLLNLVGNAVKFTDHGEVEARVELARSASEGIELARSASEGRSSPSLALRANSEEVALRFTVRDTGIGIPRDQQERIFRAFEQEDTSTTRKYEGTGLGLTIASQLVALMGGAITVQSEPGRGSTFAFTARFGRHPHAPEPIRVEPPISLHNLPVLVVDDNATNRHILEEWLRGWQMQPAAVGDGLAALDALWDAVSAGRPYALVLLDARMPDTDGLALAAKIRKRAELSATRIILLTSGDRPGDPARARELRINAHLLKPVQQDELLEAIYQVMSRSNGDAAPAARLGGEREQALAPLRILAAEDNEFNAQLLEQLLGRRGHQVRVANNGREALALAETGAFELLLLDVHMPELDGFQVVRAVRERERTTEGHLPIIALTARARQEDRERCLAAGMDDFLSKPIQAADLWAAIDRVTRRDEGRRMRDEGKTGPGLSSSLIPHLSSLLDPRVLLAACGGNAAILEKICQTFEARLPDHLKAVQDALRERDAPRLREAAHKLAGMVAALSTVAGGVASELEDHAAQGQIEEAQPLVAQLETMAPKLIRLAGELSLDILRDQATAAAEASRTAGL
jgi:PAS domain S-box-containing protein